jgi:hypothetical protein
MLAMLLVLQMPWTANLPDKGVTLDLFRPHPASGSSSLTSGTAYFGGRIPLGGVAIRFELPVAHLSAYGRTNTALGGPYVGIETNHPTFNVEAGFRPAVGPEGQTATALGYFTDISRSEAFLPHFGVVTARLKYRHRTSRGFTIAVGAGPSVWQPTNGFGNPEIALHQSVFLGYTVPRWRTEVGVNGVVVVTNTGQFQNRSLYQVGASLAYTAARVRPAVHVILPLNNVVSNVTDVVLGLGIAVAID